MINFDDDFKDWAFQVYGCFDPIMRKSLRPRNKGSDTILIFDIKEKSRDGCRWKVFNVSDRIERPNYNRHCCHFIIDCLLHNTYAC